MLFTTMSEQKKISTCEENTVTVSLSSAVDLITLNQLFDVFL